MKSVNKDLLTSRTLEKEKYTEAIKHIFVVVAYVES